MQMYLFLHRSGGVPYTFITPTGGFNLCESSNKAVYIELNEFRSNQAQFLYIVSSRFIFA